MLKNTDYLIFSGDFRGNYQLKSPAFNGEYQQLNHKNSFLTVFIGENDKTPTLKKKSPTLKKKSHPLKKQTPRLKKGLEAIDGYHRGIYTQRT